MIKNAKIRRADIIIEDHGILTFDITFDYGDSSCQGLPGWNLKQNGGLHIRSLLDAVGVESFSKLTGAACRVETDGKTEFDGLIRRVGNLLKEQWYDPKVCQ